MLDQLAQSHVPAFRFVGERYKNDGRTSTLVIDVASGTIPIAGITTGATATRSLTFRVGRAPNSDGLF